LIHILLKIIIFNTTKYVGVLLKFAWAMHGPFILLASSRDSQARIFNYASFSFQC